MNISLVIPSFNEEESIPELVSWIDKVMVVNNFSYEVIFIDDGSTDTTWQVIQTASEQNKNVRGIKFQRNYGKSAALNVGFGATKGEVVITMDADLQDSPEEIPELYKMIADDGFDLVSGWKKKRYDPITKTIPTKFYNAVTRKVSGIKLNDFNCGLKAYKSKVVKSIEVYGEMHRYIPVIAKWAGFSKIGEKVVQHQARKYGVTKFGLNRFINGPLDLISIAFVSKFGKKPMHIFGLWGGVMFVVGFLIFLTLGVQKVYHLWADIPFKNLADISWFYVALTAMILGTQLFLAGFLGELVSRNSSERNNYLIDGYSNMGQEMTPEPMSSSPSYQAAN
ncbi:MAG: glycosyltransferase family 2 protein [Flavobacteriales bacterium]|nr:glycosyltransferase family 2 protein [Flavobacteriales bacterium]